MSREVIYMYTGTIVCAALCAVFLVLSAIMLSGHGAWLLSGYNTASAEDKARYDAKKLSRAGGFLALFCTALVAGLGAATYFVETGRLEERLMTAPALIFIALLIAAIVVYGYYAATKCKK